MQRYRPLPRRSDRRESRDMSNDAAEEHVLSSCDAAEEHVLSSCDAAEEHVLSSCDAAEEPVLSSCDAAEEPVLSSCDAAEEAALEERCRQLPRAFFELGIPDARHHQEEATILSSSSSDAAAMHCSGRRCPISAHSRLHPRAGRAPRAGKVSLSV